MTWTQTFAAAYRFLTREAPGQATASLRKLFAADTSEIAAGAIEGFVNAVEEYRQKLERPAGAGASASTRHSMRGQPSKAPKPTKAEIAALKQGFTQRPSSGRFGGAVG